MDPYADLLPLSRPVSARHTPMDPGARAAQFAPFAALTGYEAIIDETGRLTQPRAEPDEDRQARLDQQLRLIDSHIAQHPVVTAVFFVPDARKDGGAYLTHSGPVKRVDPVAKQLLFAAGPAVAFSDLRSLRGELFRHPAAQPSFSAPAKP